MTPDLDLSAGSNLAPIDPAWPSCEILGDYNLLPRFHQECLTRMRKTTPEPVALAQPALRYAGQHCSPALPLDAARFGLMIRLSKPSLTESVEKQTTNPSLCHLALAKASLETLAGREISRNSGLQPGNLNRTNPAPGMEQTAIHGAIGLVQFTSTSKTAVPGEPQCVSDEKCGTMQSSHSNGMTNSTAREHGCTRVATGQKGKCLRS